MGGTLINQGETLVTNLSASVATGMATGTAVTNPAPTSPNAATTTATSGLSVNVPASISATASTSHPVNKAHSKVKIIKRYQNRKLYDTQQSCYVTLDDIAKMIRASEEVMVIDNKSKNDITAATLTQIIFEAEKKASQYAPLFTLREIIQNGNGSISNYLAKLGAFPQDYMVKQAQAQAAERLSSDDMKQNLENRVVSAANRYSTDSTVKAAVEKATILPSQAQEEETPNLPSSNQNLNQ